MNINNLNGRFGVLLALTLSLWLSSFSSVQAQNAAKIYWHTDLAKAAQQARASGKYVFLHFYGNNCAPCRAMEEQVFTNPQVIAGMNRTYIPVRINVEEQVELAQRYAVKAIPSDIILKPSGELFYRRKGGTKAEDFLFFLGFLLGQMENEAAASLPAREPAAAPVAPPVTATHAEAPYVNPVAAAPVVPAPPVAPVAPPATTTTVARSTSTSTVPGIEVSPRSNFVPIGEIRDPFTKQKVAPPSVRSIEEKTETPNEGLQAKNTRTSGRSREREEPALRSIGPRVSGRAASKGSFGGELDLSTVTVVEVPLALDGYCPVTLGDEERWVPGNPAFYTMYRGHVFRFTDEEAMETFLQSPMDYVPVAMGEDIVMTVDRNKRVYGNRKYGAWFQGRVYLFSSSESLESFAARPEFYAEIADKYETASRQGIGRF